ILICSSSAFSWGSPKISHHLPCRALSCGCATFQPSIFLRSSGVTSLYVPGVSTDGRWYFGPTTQPGKRRKSELQRSAVAARILFVAFIGVSDSLLWPCRLRPFVSASRGAHKNLSSEGLDMSLPFELSVSAQPFDSQAVEREINDRRGVEREHLAQNQSADNGDAERIAEFRTRTSAENQRQSAKEGGHGGHQNGTKAQDASLKNGIPRAFAIDPFGGQRKVDHQNGVLLDDTDQQNNADHGDNAKVLVKDHECKDGADSGGRKGGNNCEGMDVTLVENAQDDIDGHESGNNEERLRRQGRLKGLKRAGEHAGNGIGHAHFLFHGEDGTGSVAESHTRGKVEGNGD